MSHGISPSRVLEVDPNGRRAAFRTITAAMAVATSGDTVIIYPFASGYSQAAGETFPIVQPTGVNVECPGGPERTWISTAGLLGVATVWRHGSNQRVKGLRITGNNLGSITGFEIPVGADNIAWDQCVTDNMGANPFVGMGWNVLSTSNGRLKWVGCQTGGQTWKGLYVASYAGTIDVQDYSIYQNSAFSFYMTNPIQVDGPAIKRISRVHIPNMTGTITNTGIQCNGGEIYLDDCWVHGNGSAPRNYLLNGTSICYVNNCYSYAPQPAGQALACGSAYTVRVRGGNIRRADCLAAGGACLIFNGVVGVLMVAGTFNTNAIAPSQRLRYTTPTGLVAGTYRLRANAKLFASAAVRTGYARVQVDDLTTPIGWSTNQTTADNTKHGWYPVTLTAGAHNIDLDYWVDNAVGSVSITDPEVALEEYGGSE